MDGNIVSIPINGLMYSIFKIRYYVVNGIQNRVYRVYTTHKGGFDKLTQNPCHKIPYFYVLTNILQQTIVCFIVTNINGKMTNNVRVIVSKLMLGKANIKDEQ